MNIYSTAEEVEFGKSLDKEVRKQYEILEDERITAFLQDRGQKLGKVCGRPDIEYHFAAVNSDEVNAFAIPGGYCYINLGLIRQSGSEAELISVVAHEIGHVVRRHSMKRLSQMQLAGLVSEIALGGRAGSAKRTVAELFTATGMLYYSRQAEREADYAGIVNMYDAGYDPRGMVDMFVKLKNAQEGRDPQGWQMLFSTHPMTVERIGNARATIARMPPKEGLVMNTPEWKGIIEYVSKNYPPKKKEKQKGKTVN